MKRVGNLISSIVELDNLKIAYVKACRAKPLTQDLLQFRSSLEDHLNELGDELASGGYIPGSYRFFTVTDPKERLISAARFRDRVAQHALMNVLDPIFDRYQIDHSYACRRGKGTQAAVLTAFHHCKSQPWFLKLDVRRYFDSIDHRILKVQLERRIKDTLVLNALFSIIDSYSSAPGRGLPIGNLTSQYFANHYLAALDHAVLERLQVSLYVRYMDDSVLWASSKAALVQAYAFLVEETSQRLALTLKPPLLNKAIHGLPFLGFLIHPTGIFLQEKTRLRYRKTQIALAASLVQGTVTQQQYADRALAAASHLGLARSRSFRHSVFRQGFFGLEPRESGRQLEQQCH